MKSCPWCIFVRLCDFPAPNCVLSDCPLQSLAVLPVNTSSFSTLKSCAIWYCPPYYIPRCSTGDMSFRVTSNPRGLCQCPPPSISHCCTTAISWRLHVTHALHSCVTVRLSTILTVVPVPSREGDINYAFCVMVCFSPLFSLLPGTTTFSIFGAFAKKPANNSSTSFKKSVVPEV